VFKIDAYLFRNDNGKIDTDVNFFTMIFYLCDKEHGNFVTSYSNFIRSGNFTCSTFYSPCSEDIQ